MCGFISKGTQLLALRPDAEVVQRDYWGKIVDGRWKINKCLNT